MTIGDRIKSYRELRGMTQQDLAERIGLRDKTSISKIEKSDEITLKNALRLSKALGCTVFDLMGWSEEIDEENQIASTLVLDSFPSDSDKMRLPDDADENAMKLLETYDELSEEGKKSLIDYADFLYRKEMYK